VARAGSPRRPVALVAAPLAALFAGVTLAASAVIVPPRGLASNSEASHGEAVHGEASIGEGDADDYLAWPRDRAEALASSTRSRDSAGQSWWDTRGTKTERSLKYKVVATWMTPEVIRATARLLQLRDGLSAEATRALVAEADRPGETTVMVDIDPHEGSGVIPLDWQAYLGPYAGGKGIDGTVAGTGTPRLRDLRALAGIGRRDYAYDRFWMVFPLKNANGQPLFGPQATEAELIVRIYDKEARVKWPIPASIRSADD
jgi:hypothetical protein